MTTALFDEALELAAISTCIDIPEFIDTGPSTDHFACRLPRMAHAALIELRRSGSDINDLTLLHAMERRGMGRRPA